MVKKIKAEASPNVQKIEESNPLSRYLPHDKFIVKKEKLLRKTRSLAINSIQLDKIQIKNAIKSILAYMKEHADPADLFGEQEFVYLEVDTSRIPTEHTVKPTQIELPFPIYSKEFNSRFTVFVSNPEEQFTDAISELELPMTREVIGYDKLKKNFKQLKDKRSLLASSDLFFCDWKIYNLLRQPLGKLFYERKKFPYPIDCSGNVPSNLTQRYKNYESYLNDLANSTYFMMGNGPVYTIKVGRAHMNLKELVKNVMHGAYGLISTLLAHRIKPEDIRQISIKSYNSPSLPIYNFLSAEEIKSFKYAAK